MTPQELTDWRTKNKLSQIALAKELGVTKGCISLWESGDRKIPPFLHITLKCLKVQKGGGVKKEGTKKKKEVKK